jgi:hypothetical protein
MKMIVLLITCFTSFWFCHSISEQQERGVASIVAVKSDTLYFKTQLQPVLVQNCSPCHFPGGKMYERMPFDQGETILRHGDGIVKRFSKKEKELGLLKKFIEEHKTMQ